MGISISENDNNSIKPTGALPARVSRNDGQHFHPPTVAFVANTLSLL